MDATSKSEDSVPTTAIHHRQRRHSSLHKDVESFDDGRVRVNESNVSVCADAQFPQSVLHESRLWHFTHLKTTQIHKITQG